MLWHRIYNFTKEGIAALWLSMKIKSVKMISTILFKYRHPLRFPCLGMCSFYLNYATNLNIQRPVLATA